MDARSQHVEVEDFQVRGNGCQVSILNANSLIVRESNVVFGGSGEVNRQPHTQTLALHFRTFLSAVTPSIIGTYGMAISIVFGR